MGIEFCSAHAGGDAAQAAALLIDAICARLAQPKLVLVFASMKQGLGEMLPRVAKAFPTAVVIGSSTAGEFTDGADTRDGTVAVALGGDGLEVHGGLGRGLKDDVMGAVQGSLASLPAAVDGKPHRTALLLLDTLAGRGEEAALLASALLGEDVRLAGGAAGDDQMATTWVGLGSEVATDAVVTAMLYTTRPLGVGVSHGHRPLSPKLTVTRADGNVIREVDGRPAWEVWVEHTRGAALERGIDPAALDDPSRILDFLVVYEAGLQIGRAYKMRAPLLRGADGSLTFACGVPEGTRFQIMEGLPEAQIESAREAAQRAVEQLGGSASGAVVFDCVCRKAILKERFREAIEAIATAVGGPVGGFETYGEIALEIGAMSGFHNTTTVVVAFPR